MRRRRDPATQSAGQLTTARDQPVRLPERFIHPFASGQIHSDQRVHASAVDQSEGDGSCSDSLTPPLKAAAQSVIVRRMSYMEENRSGIGIQSDLHIGAGLVLDGIWVAEAAT